jgi:hypothetical protein
MTGLGAADVAEADGVTEGADASPDADADGAKLLKGRLEMIAAASLGETVVVLTNELAPPGLYEPE